MNGSSNSHDSTPGRRVARRAAAAALAALLLAGLLPSARVERAAEAAGGPATRADVTEALARTPLSFVESAGRFGESVKFHAQGAGGSALFEADGLLLSAPAGPRRPSAALRLRFVGASKSARPTPGRRLPGTVNYFVGRDPAQWRAGLPTYAGLIYEELYRGVTLSYDGAGGKLKGTYRVAPGASPAQVRWRYEGAASVRVDAQTGDLRVRPAGGGAELVERAPVAWQERSGRRVSVEARYELGPDDSVGFALGPYEAGRELVIDPTLEFSRVLGGEGRDYGYGVAVDRDGNVYLAGVTSSATPTPALQLGAAQAAFGGKTDVFVVKLNPSGDTVLYSTYLGGGDDDWGFAVALDAVGRAHVAGYTRSADFPLAGALQGSFRGGPVDAFAAKLSADGTALVYSTYLGGADEEAAYGVAVGPTGEAAYVGYTRSADFPLARARQAAAAGQEDAFVVKLSEDGRALLYGSYLGGRGSDRAQAVAADREGNLYLAGSTDSADFPVADALQAAGGGREDAFVAKLRPDGTEPIFSTYLGGAASDSARALALDPWGHVYLTGSTRSADFPTANAFRPNHAGGDDAFVLKLDRKGKRLRFSTYLGGAGDDYGLGIAVGRAGLPVVTGRTRSADFPLAGSLRAATDGEDAFVTRLAADGSAPDFSTYLGGSRREMAEAVALDASGNVHVAGYTYSEDFPNSNAEPFRYLTEEDAFVLKIAAPAPPAAPCQSLANVAAGSVGATAAASSVYPNEDFSAASAIDGDRAGARWGAGGGWADGTRDAYPDWLEVSFADVMKVGLINVYTLSNGYAQGVEPTAATAATLYGLTDFEVQYWDGSAWRTVPGGEVKGNGLARRSITFEPVTTDRVRLLVTNARNHFSRVVELEAFGCPAP